MAAVDDVETYMRERRLEDPLATSATGLIPLLEPWLPGLRTSCRAEGAVQRDAGTTPTRRHRSRDGYASA